MCLFYSEIPACESSPCLNGGSCTNTDTGFTCDCAEGWRGDTCEESKNTSGLQLRLTDKNQLHVYSKAHK